MLDAPARYLCRFVTAPFVLFTVLCFVKTFYFTINRRLTAISSLASPICVLCSSGSDITASHPVTQNYTFQTPHSQRASASHILRERMGKKKVVPQQVSCPHSCIDNTYSALYELETSVQKTFRKAAHCISTCITVTLLNYKTKKACL